MNTHNATHVALYVALAAWLSAPCPAARAAGGEPPRPTVFHVPPTIWTSESPARLVATVDEDWRLASLTARFVLVRVHGQSPVTDAFRVACLRTAAGAWDPEGAACELPLLRGDGARHVLELPPELVQPPGVAYSIAGVGHDGTRYAHFASAADPYPVLVHEPTAASVRADRLARHQGRRNRLELRADGTALGAGTLMAAGGGAPIRSDRFSDRYGEVSLVYTHRLLGTLYAFRFGLGIMRGARPSTATPAGVVVAGAGKSPGVNYGWGELDFELAPSLSAAVRVDLGASEDGFVGGAGALVRVGPHHATHVELGFDALSSVGPRGWLSFRWDTIPRVPMGITLELSDWPSADTNDLLARMFLDVGFEATAAIDLSARVGYAQRTDSFEGGFVLGLAGAWEF